MKDSKGQFCTVDINERFWSKVDKSGDCWEWKAFCFPSGYGSFWVQGKVQRAHRICWELTFGPIPDGVQVLHHCDNKACVRPNHLWLGAHADNMADMVEKGRSAHGESIGTSQLNATEVVEIRELSFNGMTQRPLARLFGISQGQIHRIIHRTHWARVRGV